MATHIVTGVAGFIASHPAEKLLQKDVSKARKWLVYNAQVSLSEG